MGIPSYYKKLCDRIPGLLSKVRKGQQPTHLWIDFNCMVYHCLRRPGAPIYAGEETRIEWENHLIQDCCQYVKKIVKLVGPTEQVFVGVDGVVPMAKMRQQRLRRFKSPWIAAEEMRLGKASSGPRWDSNSITPGTAFMERLGSALHELRSGGGGPKWVVSAADEPGEGEHKAMKGIRNCKSRSSHVIYGLDADLIVLALLQPIQEIWLFREAVECGEVQYTDNEEEYRYFSIHNLRDYVTKDCDKDYLLDYCMAMSFLGNDFLPHGLSLKIKDGGHDILLQMLKDVRKDIGPLIDTTLGRPYWRPVALRACLDWLAEKEEGWISHHCVGKLRKRFQPARGATELEVALDEWNKTPLRQCEERCLLGAVWKDEGDKHQGRLREDWKTVYYQRWFQGSSKRPVQEYLKGLDWILQYYWGNPVNYHWCFPWLLPPLWSDLAKEASKHESFVAPSPETGLPLKPQEQLALVLPLSSWGLLRDKNLRRLPYKAPQFWPKQFELFTAGHAQIWECEAKIPLLMPERLYSLLETNEEINETKQTKQIKEIRETK
jgi:5'-3' exonuclease